MLESITSVRYGQTNLSRGNFGIMRLALLSDANLSIPSLNPGQILFLHVLGSEA